MTTAGTPPGRAFELDEAIALLERTPRALDALLRGLPEGWIAANEGEGTWSPFDVVGHLIHGERTDWMPRIRMILEHRDSRTFESFDRFAQFEASRGWTLPDLLDEFGRLRGENIRAVMGLGLTTTDLARRGSHPDFGPVTLRQLLATWAVHDLDHLSQIARVLARQYADDVGPWRAYLRIINGRD
jgi:hypothetical protein